MIYTLVRPKGERYLCKKCGRMFWDEAILFIRTKCPDCGSHNTAWGDTRKSLYRCGDCNHSFWGRNWFSGLLNKNKKPLKCPKCGSQRVESRMENFIVY